MSGEKIIRALDAIPDAQLQSAMGVYERRKKLQYIWVRAIACAAVLVLLVGLVLFSDGTGGKAPLVSVIVYADDGDGVELRLPKQDSAISNVSDENNLPHSSGPLPEHDKTRFFFTIILNEYEKQYAGYKVYQDGKELTRLNTKELTVATAFRYESSTNNGESHYSVSTETIVFGHTEKATVIEVHYLKESGDLLLKCVISVTPQEEGFLVILEEVYAPHG